MWKYHGQQRPDFAEMPKTGQESVWDYPRPPIVVTDSRTVEVWSGDILLARSTQCLRVLETASPPTFYLPRGDIDMIRLVRVDGRSFCEWKGAATYWALASQADMAVGWSYEQPTEAFADIRGFLSFYPGRLTCAVNGERVRPQPGGFYGGWLTDEIAGPVKGIPGTGHW